MTHIPDDIFLGNFGPAGFSLGATGSETPTLNQGVGPMGRVFVYTMIPLTVAVANVAALQHMTSGAAMTLVAGTGVTAGLSPDGLGRTVYSYDVPRALSLTSTANLSAINFTILGYDQYGVPMSQVKSGPNNNTVNTLKAFKSIYKVTPGTTDASNNVSVGSSDVFGLPFVLADIGYILSVKWAETLAPDAGTPVIAVATDPATTATGDVRGTYLPSSGASNGTRRLVLAQYLTAAQCGPAATLASLMGVTQA